MKSIIFVFIINYILFISKSLLFVTSLRQSYKVPIYNNDYLLSWDIDKNTSVIPTFKLTYYPINMCLLERNIKTERYEEKLLFPFSTIDSTRIRRREKKISKFDVKLFYHGMLYILFFVALPSIFLSNLDEYYKTNKKNSKLIEASKFSSTKQIKLTIAN
uniref:Uncharacterized protein n=1 Tax=Strongyloides venezuelensis TaxID=75913 RepID=A0A0K0G1Q8_STRVS